MQWSDLPAELRDYIVGMQPSSCRIYCKSMRDAASVHAATTLRASIPALLKIIQDMEKQQRRLEVAVKNVHLAEDWTHGDPVVDAEKHTRLQDTLAMFDVEANAFFELACDYQERLNALFLHYAWHEELRLFTFVHTLRLVAYVMRYDPSREASQFRPPRYGPFRNTVSTCTPMWNKGRDVVFASRLWSVAFNKMRPLIEQHRVIWAHFAQGPELEQYDMTARFGLATLALLRALRGRYTWVGEADLHSFGFTIVRD